MSRNRSWGIAAKGEQKPQDSDFVGVFVYIVSPGYLKAMGCGCSWAVISDGMTLSTTEA
jgi:hypothetical protein